MTNKMLRPDTDKATIEGTLSMENSGPARVLVA